jgi:hypothetical protein
MVSSTQERIRMIAGSGLIKDLKVKPSEKCSPPHLSAIECLSFNEEDKVLVITDHIDRMLSSLKVMMPSFEFLVMNVVVALSQVRCL